MEKKLSDNETTKGEDEELTIEETEIVEEKEIWITSERLLGSCYHNWIVEMTVSCDVIGEEEEEHYRSISRERVNEKMTGQLCQRGEWVEMREKMFVQD